MTDPACGGPLGPIEDAAPGVSGTSSLWAVSSTLLELRSLPRHMSPATTADDTLAG